MQNNWVYQIITSNDGCSLSQSFHLCNKSRQVIYPSFVTTEGSLIIGIGFLTSLWLGTAVRNWCVQHWNFLRHAARMNGPPALPIIGNAQYFIGSTNDFLGKMLLTAQLYESPARFWFGPKLGVAINDPSQIEIIMTSSIAKYKPSEYRFVETYFGRGLITSSGPTHKKHRSLIMPMVNGQALTTYIDDFDIQSRRCVECLESMVDKGEFDILSYMNLYSMDITFDSIIGAPAVAQQNGNTELVNCIQRLCCLSYERTFKLWLHPDCIYYRTRAGKELKKAKAIVQKFMDDMVAEKKKKYHEAKNTDPNSNPSQYVLLDRMIAYNEENKLMDDKRLADEVFTVFAAAQDPTALVSSFLFMMLGMHSDVQEKVRVEVQGIVGDGTPTPKTISELRYLDLVIKETLRLFPIAPLLFREVHGDIKFGTCTIPEGCIVGIFAFGVHRDPKFWKEPEKFDPDRFLPENSVTRHPYAYIPFSGGSRGCIGQQYAKMAIKILVTRVIQKYRIHSSGSLENLKLITDICVRSLDGYRVSIRRL